MTTATTTDATLTSSILDTGVSGGAGFNSLLWQGSLGTGGIVKFQIAFPMLLLVLGPIMALLQPVIIISLILIFLLLFPLLELLAPKTIVICAIKCISLPLLLPPK